LAIGIKLKSFDNSKKIGSTVKLLTAREVLAGFPESTAGRKETGVNNATLAYIHDKGSPARGIPQREFVHPGIKLGQEEIVARLGQGARMALDGNRNGVEQALNAAGLIAQKSIRKKISDGPFTPLKPATIRARNRKHRGRTSTSVRPLIDTGQMRQAVNYVVTDKKK